MIPIGALTAVRDPEILTDVGAQYRHRNTDRLVRVTRAEDGYVFYTDDIGKQRVSDNKTFFLYFIHASARTSDEQAQERRP